MTASARRPLATIAATLAAAIVTLAACGGGDTAEVADTGRPDATDEQADVETVAISFDLGSPFGDDTLSAEQLEQFDAQEAAVVAGIAATIASSPGNAEIGLGHVLVDALVVVSDGREAILVTYRVPQATVVSSFGGPEVDEQVLQVVYPALVDGRLSTVDEATADIAVGVAFPPNFIPDETEPLSSLIDYNDAIGGGESRTVRPDGAPVRAFEFIDGPTLLWP